MILAFQRWAQRLHEHFSGHALAWTIAVVTGWLALSPIALRRGMLHPEVYDLLPHYLSPRPFSAIVFDVDRTDFGNYQARELSYMLDWLDAQVIALGVDHGWPHFLSASHYALMLATAAMLGWCARRAFDLPPLVAALGVALFVTTPAVFLGGTYFRSAKAGAAFCVVAAGTLALMALRPKAPGSPFPWEKWLGCGLGVFGAALFDRQGAFLGGLLTAMLLAHAALGRGHARWRWASIATMGLALSGLYNHVVGPRLIRHFAGYSPSFSFQEIPLCSAFTDPSTAYHVFFYGPLLFLDDARFLFGNLPATIVGIGLVAFALWLWRHARLVPSVQTLIPVFLVPLGLLAMNMAMLVRLRVVSLEFRRTYYGLPSTAMLALFALYLTAECWRQFPPFRRWIVITLALFAGSNAFSLIDHRLILLNGHDRHFWAATTGVLQRLRELPAQGVSKAPTDATTAPTSRYATDSKNDEMVQFFVVRHDRSVQAAPLRP